MTKFILFMVVCSGIPGNECKPISTPIEEFDTYHQIHKEKASGLSILDWLMQDDIESIIEYLHKPGEYHYES